MEAANNAAFVAPELPTAKVPTGIPPGICTILKRLSIPLKDLIYNILKKIANKVLTLFE